MSIISVRRLGLVAASALLVGTLGACGGTSGLEGESLTAIRLNPTPSEITLHQTRDDINNRRTITFDENFLMLNDDLERLMLFERPSRLTPYPVAY